MYMGNALHHVSILTCVLNRNSENWIFHWKTLNLCGKRDAFVWVTWIIISNWNELDFLLIKKFCKSRYERRNEFMVCFNFIVVLRIQNEIFFQKSSSFYTVNDNFSFCLVYMVVYQVERIFVVYFIDDEAFN